MQKKTSEERDDDVYEECLALALEVEEMCQVQAVAVDWIDFCDDAYKIFSQFEENLDTIESAFPIAKDKRFLIGILFVGIISAYEGFVHKLFHICLNHSKLFDKALKSQKSLTKKQKKYLRIGKEIFKIKKEFKNTLDRLTLNDYSKVTDLFTIFFDVDIHSDSSRMHKNILEIRNAFTHNCGYDLKNRPIVLTYDDLVNHHQSFYNIINEYSYGFLQDAHNDLIKLKKACQ